MEIITTIGEVPARLPTIKEGIVKTTRGQIVTMAIIQTTMARLIIIVIPAMGITEATHTAMQAIT